MVGNLTCDELAAEIAADPSSGIFHKNATLVEWWLQGQYDDFYGALNQRDLTLSDVNKHCIDLYNRCQFADAQQCFFDDLSALSIFLSAYLPLAVVLVTIALVFNVLSICLVIKVRQKSPRHFLLINLSISDFSLSLFTVMKRSADFLSDHNSAKQTILNYGNMMWQSCWLVSCFGLLFLATDCYLAVRFVFLYEKRLTSVVVRIVVTALWIVSLVFTGLLVHFELNYSNPVQIIICVLMFVILSLIVAQSLYAFSLTERIRRLQMSTNREDRTLRRQARLSRFKSTLTIVILLTSSFISWLPLVVFFTLPETWHPANSDLSQKFVTVCLLCFHMNAIVNPIVYSLRFRDVRAPLRRNLAKNKFTRPIGRLLMKLDDDMESFYYFQSAHSHAHRRKTVSCSASVSNDGDNNNNNSDNRLDKRSMFYSPPHHNKTGGGKPRSASFDDQNYPAGYYDRQNQSFPIGKPKLNSISENGDPFIGKKAGDDDANKESTSSIFAGGNNTTNNSSSDEASELLLMRKNSSKSDNGDAPFSTNPDPDGDLKITSANATETTKLDETIDANQL